MIVAGGGTINYTRLWPTQKKLADHLFETTVDAEEEAFCEGAVQLCGQDE